MSLRREYVMTPEGLCQYGKFPRRHPDSLIHHPIEWLKFSISRITPSPPTH